MNIILLNQAELINSNTVTLSDRRFEHIKNVLKPEIGDLLRAGIVGGKRFQAKLVEMTSNYCTLELQAELANYQEPLLDLILALPRPKCMKRLWAQLSSIGFKRIFIVNAEKVEKVYWGSSTLAEEAYMPLLLEGLEQSGDTILPEIKFIKRLRPFLEDDAPDLFSNQLKILAHPYEEGIESISFNMLQTDTRRRVVAIGPEGGWNSFEIKLFDNAGFKAFSMGERILRTDTAVIGLAAILNFSPKSGS